MADIAKFYIFLLYTGIIGKIFGIGFQGGKLLLILIGSLLVSYLSFIPYIPLNSTIFFVIISIPVIYIFFKKKIFIDREDLVSEIIFISVFLFALFVRMHSPDIFGAEKPMEFAFINSIARTSHLPPYDPWLLGYVNPYYYFGFIPIVLIAKFLFIQNAVMYNLYSCFIFAITAAIVFELLYREKKHTMVGIIGVIIVNFMANYERILAVFKHKRLIDYWASSRVIPNTINEFPLFSFIHGDNHPHYLFLPLSIIGIYLIWKENKILLIIFSVFIFIINPWGMPFFLFLWIIKRYIDNGFKINDIIDIISYYVVAFIFSLPFLYTRGHTPLGIGIVSKGSNILPLFTHFGPFILLTLTMLKRDDLIAIVKYVKKYSYILIISILFIIFRPSLIMGLFVLALYVLTKEEKDKKRKFFLMLLAYSYLVITGCEIIYIKDIYAHGAFFRGNTVFKFYYLSWIGLGISVAYLNFLKKTKILPLLMVLIITPALLYLPLGIMAKINTHLSPTLNGMRFLKLYHPEDFSIIDYINKNIKGHPGIVEVTGKRKAYTYYGRISTYTGLPTILGWSMHELIWRGYIPQGAEREEAIKTIYTGTMKEKEPLIFKYHIRYMIIGGLEKLRFKDKIIYPTSTKKIKVKNIQIGKGKILEFIY